MPAKPDPQPEVSECVEAHAAQIEIDGQPRSTSIELVIGFRQRSGCSRPSRIFRSLRQRSDFASPRDASLSVRVETVPPGVGFPPGLGAGGAALDPPGRWAQRMALMASTASQATSSAARKTGPKSASASKAIPPATPALIAPPQRHRAARHRCRRRPSRHPIRRDRAGANSQSRLGLPARHRASRPPSRQPADRLSVDAHLIANLPPMPEGSAMLTRLRVHFWRALLIGRPRGSSAEPRPARRSDSRFARQPRSNPRP